MDVYIHLERVESLISSIFCKSICKSTYDKHRKILCFSNPASPTIIELIVQKCTVIYNRRYNMIQTIYHNEPYTVQILMFQTIYHNGTKGHLSRLDR